MSLGRVVSRNTDSVRLPHSVGMRRWSAGTGVSNCIVSDDYPIGVDMERIDGVLAHRVGVRDISDRIAPSQKEPFPEDLEALTEARSTSCDLAGDCVPPHDLDWD